MQAMKSRLFSKLFNLSQLRELNAPFVQLDKDAFSPYALEESNTCTHDCS